MHLSSLKNRRFSRGLLGVILVCLGGTAWAYGAYLSPHAKCVGAVRHTLVAREFAQFPERAGYAADRLCDRAADHADQATHLLAGHVR